MVLTPKFHFTQSDEELVVHVCLPHIKISGMELMVLDQRDFSFYCRPYLLRLTLPGTVYGEDEEDVTKRPSAQFLPDTSILLCKLKKINPGEVFQGLELITTMLAAPSSLSAARQSGRGTGRYGLGEELKGEYGFLTNFSNFFGEDGFLSEFPDLIDLPNPDFTPPEARTELRIFHENAMFDYERYRVDLREGGLDYLYEQAMEYDVMETYANVVLTDSERLILQQLASTAASTTANVMENGGGEEQANILRARACKVVDVLLAYCYELRFCTGDFSVESHIMIRKLSSTLSWLQEFNGPNGVNLLCQSFARRCLCFPYLRRWDLCCRAAQDCCVLLADGTKMVKALLTLRQLFQKSQSAYLLNRLFVDDMCVFVQHEARNAPIFAEIKQVLLDTFAGQRKVPSVQLVTWNLAPKRAASKKSTTASAAPTAVVELPPSQPAPSTAAADRDFVEELD